MDLQLANTSNLDFTTVLVTIICTVLIFLFPAVRGPYSAVNGPVTGLRAMVAGLRMRFLIALPAIHLASLSVTSCLHKFSSACRTLFLPHSPPHDDLVLRC